MKGKRIEGRCYKARTKRGLFRMKKKSHADLEMDRYTQALSYIAGREERCIELMAEATKNILREREEQSAAEKVRVIRMSNEDPASLLAMGM